MALNFFSNKDNQKLIGAGVAGASAATLFFLSTRQSSGKKAAKADAKPVILYSSPICPFAHRGHIALLEMGAPFTYERVPLNGELKKAHDGRFNELKAWQSSSPAKMQALKDAYKKNINPTGEVPSIVHGDTIVTEADVVAEYLSDAFSPAGQSKLFPADPALRSKIRHAFKMLSGNTGVSAFYGLLMNQDPSKDLAYRDKIYGFLGKVTAMMDSQGPFFSGAEFMFMDIMLVPFLDRFRFTLKHYRGIDFVPTDAEKFPWLPRFLKWQEAVLARPSFIASTMPKEVYLNGYKGYAGERGASTPSV